MKIEPVVWRKGDFLNPQQLQAHDRYLEELLHFKVDALAYRPWGFLSFALDRHQLAGGSLHLSEAAGIFPDGLPFNFPHADTAPVPRNIQDCFAPGQKSLDVFLGIPAYQEGGVNIMNPRNPVDARFRSEFALVRDDNTGDSERPVPIARKNLRILVESEAKAHGSVLRFARVNRTQAGFELDPGFVPPLIDFRASESLKTTAREAVALLSSRASEIPVNLRSFTSSEIANFWLLYTINSHLPVLRDLHEKRSAHPEVLYSELSQLAAQLTTFSSEVSPRDLRPYDHDEIGACFAQLRKQLRILLETAIPRNHVALSLKQIKPAIYSTALDDPKYLDSRMYFAIRASINKADVMKKAPGQVKISSAGGVERLVRKQVNGLELTFSDAPRGFSALKTDYQYFAIAQAGDEWQEICRARTLAAFVPAEFGDLDLELIIVLPEGS